MNGRILAVNNRDIERKAPGLSLNGVNRQGLSAFSESEETGIFGQILQTLGPELTTN